MLPPFCLLKPKEQRKTGMALDLAVWSQSKALCGGTEWIKWVSQAHLGCRHLVTGPTPASCSTCSPELWFWTKEISEPQAVPLGRVASPTGDCGVQTALWALCQMQLERQFLGIPSPLLLWIQVQSNQKWSKIKNFDLTFNRNLN